LKVMTLWSSPASMLCYECLRIMVIKLLMHENLRTGG